MAMTLRLARLRISLNLVGRKAQPGEVGAISQRDWAQGFRAGYGEGLPRVLWLALHLFHKADHVNS